MINDTEQIVKGAVEYLRALLNPLLDKPEALVIETHTDLYGLNLVITIAEPEVKFILGTNGYAASCIRKVMRMYGYKNKCRLNFLVKGHEQEML